MKPEIEYKDSNHSYWELTREMVGDKENIKKKRLPAVTTITGIFDKSRALQGYTAKVNAEEAIREIKEYSEGGTITTLSAIDCVEKAKGYYKTYATAAADIGTTVHELITEFFKGNEVSVEGMSEEVIKAYNAFLEVIIKIGFKAVEVERIVHGISEFGDVLYVGRLDVVVEIDGKLFVWDWKTGKGIYESDEMQVAAYADMYESETGKEISGTKIWQLNKETGEIGEPKEFDRVQTAINLSAFRSCYALYAWNKGRGK